MTLGTDGSVTVTDNGRGIPVDMHATMKKPALEVVMTTLHAGGKPSVRDMFEGVYKDMPPHLRRQRQQAGV